MDAYLAIAPAASQAPAPTGSMANAVTGSATSGNDGATGFADGMQSLLAAIDGNDNRADSNSMPSGGDQQGAGSATSVETAKGLPAPAASASVLPQRGTEFAFNQTKFRPNLGDSLPAAKSTERSGAATASNPQLHDRNFKAMHAERAAAAALAQPLISADPSAVAPAQIPAPMQPNSKEQPANGVTRIPVSTSGLTFQPEQSAEAGPHSALAGDLPEATGASLMPQQPAAEPVGAQSPHSVLNPHPAQLASDPSASADPIAGAPANGPAAGVSPANPGLLAPNTNSGPTSGAAPISARRIEAAPSAGRSFKSALRDSASPLVGDPASLHVPAQGTPASTMPVRDATGIEDRRSVIPSPSPVSTPSIADQDTFAALDSAAAGPHTTWIHAGAHHAEAGYLDPALGWVSVRADGTASGLHAALIPGSPEAASALGNQLAGLNAFMAEHQGHTATITLAAPESGSQHAGTSQQDGAMNGRQQQQEPNQAAPNTRGVNPSPQTESATSRIAVPQAMAGSQATSGIGVHLSVMA